MNDQRKLAKLKVENAMLRIALQFYSDEANWQSHWDNKFKVYVRQIDCDQGKRSGVALMGLPSASLCTDCHMYGEIKKALETA